MGPKATLSRSRLQLRNLPEERCVQILPQRAPPFLVSYQSTNQNKVGQLGSEGIVFLLMLEYELSFHSFIHPVTPKYVKFFFPSFYPSVHTQTVSSSN